MARKNLKRVTAKEALEASKQLRKYLNDREEFLDILTARFHLFTDDRKKQYHHSAFCVVVMLKKLLSTAAMSRGQRYRGRLARRALGRNRAGGLRGRWQIHSDK